MKKYEAPVVEVMSIVVEDVIATSEENFPNETPEI